MFREIFEKIFNKPVKLFYYGSLKRIIAEDIPTYNENVLIGKNCSIHPSAIITCVKNSTIQFEGNNYVGRNVEIGADNSKIFFGYNTSIQDRCIILGNVEIGRHCLFAPNVYISSGRHNFDFKPEFCIKDQDDLVSKSIELSEINSKKVVIEDDCWIGINVVITQGVIIKKGSVIGANAVVTKNVEPYSVMGGSPAKLIKHRLNFELKESIDYLNDTHLPYFYNGFYTDLENLIKDRKEGGICVMANFKVYLKGKEKKYLILKIKHTNKTSVSIEYFNQVKEIPVGDFCDITFDIQNVDLHLFKISLNEEEKGKVLIQSIKTE